MMKRTFSFMLALLICLSLAACGKSDAPEAVSKTENTVASTENSSPEAGDREAAEAVSESENVQAAPVYEPERYETMLSPGISMLVPARFPFTEKALCAITPARLPNGNRI